MPRAFHGLTHLTFHQAHEVGDLISWLPNGDTEAQGSAVITHGPTGSGGIRTQSPRLLPLWGPGSCSHVFGSHALPREELKLKSVE